MFMERPMIIFVSSLVLGLLSSVLAILTAVLGWNCADTGAIALMSVFAIIGIISLCLTIWGTTDLFKVSKGLNTIATTIGKTAEFGKAVMKIRHKKYRITRSSVVLLAVTAIISGFHAAASYLHAYCLNENISGCDPRKDPISVAFIGTMSGLLILCVTIAVYVGYISMGYKNFNNVTFEQIPGFVATAFAGTVEALEEMALSRSESIKKQTKAKQGVFVPGIS